jgi:hypothetical protein
MWKIQTMRLGSQYRPRYTILLDILDGDTDTEDHRVVLSVSRVLLDVARGKDEGHLRLTTRAFTTIPSSVLEYCHQCIA